MNAGSLAVIFAPNLLRPAKEPSAMQALEEVKHRTVVIQSIIESTIRKYVSTLAKINSLDAVRTPVYCLFVFFLVFTVYFVGCKVLHMIHTGFRKYMDFKSP